MDYLGGTITNIEQVWPPVPELVLTERRNWLALGPAPYRLLGHVEKGCKLGVLFEPQGGHYVSLGQGHAHGQSKSLFTCPCQPLFTASRQEFLT